MYRLFIWSLEIIVVRKVKVIKTRKRLSQNETAFFVFAKKSGKS